MKEYYLYRLNLTGVTMWKYLGADFTDRFVPGPENFMNCFIVPDMPVCIYSEKYGKIMSPFDYGTTRVPGMTRYGKTENGENVFGLRWEGDDYVFEIAGYPPICAVEKAESVRVAYSVLEENKKFFFMQGEEEIARIVPVNKDSVKKFTGEFTEADAIKKLTVKQEFLPVLEILSSFIELRFGF